MNISWLTVRDLEYIVTTARLLHFGKAAEACHVSQPALSTQIKKVETLLDLLLFERSQRKVTLTQAGQAIVEQAHVLLEEAQKLIEISKKKERLFSSHFIVGSIASLGPYLIPHILGPLRKAYPQGKFVFQEGLTHTLLHDLKEGNLDVVLAADTFEDDQLIKIPLFHEPFVLATPKHHPLSHKSPLYPKDLHAEEMVLLADGHCLKDQTLELCSLRKSNSKSNKKSENHFQATSLETLRHLIASGMGYSLLPFLATQETPQIKKLIDYTEFKDKKIGRNIVLVYRARYTRLKEIELFVDLIKKNLPQGIQE